MKSKNIINVTTIVTNLKNAVDGTTVKPSSERD